jgi:hypothetical protein
MPFIQPALPLLFRFRQQKPVADATAVSGMTENVLGGPAGKVEPGAVGQEAEACRGKFGAAFAGQHRVKLFLERVKI